MLGILGGAPQKRPRVTVSDMKPKPDDVPMVVACFDYKFDANMFIQELKTNHRDQLIEFKTRIDARSTEQIGGIALDYITEFNTLKDT